MTFKEAVLALLYRAAVAQERWAEEAHEAYMEAFKGGQGER